jgi:hypothetical protein
MDFNFSRKLVLITVKLHQASTLATGLAAAGVAAVLATATPGRSAQWPARPVTVIVPLAAGGNTDMMARLGAQHLSEKLGQTFIVENPAPAVQSAPLRSLPQRRMAIRFCSRRLQCCCSRRCCRNSTSRR